MPRRHPALPTRWLMTDERLGEALWEALDALPRGSGVVFRHYSLPPNERRALLARIERVARRRRLVVLGAGIDASGGRHGGQRRRGWLSYAVHAPREAIAARRAGADVVFVSPVHSTRSHPGARSLGRVRFGLLVRGIGIPVIALGGVDARGARALRAFGIHGWAAIDAWTLQKRKAVPT